MADDRTTLDAESTLERIRAVVEAIKDRLPVADTPLVVPQKDNGLFDVLHSFIESINSRLAPILTANVASPTATATGSNVSATTETPIEQIASVVSAIKTRLDGVLSALTSQKTPAASNATQLGQTQKGTPLDLIAQHVQAIRHRLDANAITASTPPSIPPPPATPSNQPSGNKGEGFLDFMRGIGASIAKMWAGPPPAPPPAAVPVPPVTMMGMPITNPALLPSAPTATIAPPVPSPAAPGWLAGLGNLFSSSLSRLAGNKPEGFGSRLSGFGSKMMEAGTNPSGFGSVGDVFGGVSKLAGAIPGVGGPIAGIAKLGEVAFKSVDRLQEWTSSLHNANMQFAEFSGAMASVQASQNIRDIEYSAKRGEKRAESAGYLAEGHSELRDAMAPISDAVTDIKNYLAGSLAKGVGGIITGLNKLIGLSQKENTADSTGGKELFREAAEVGEEFWKNKANPQI